MPPIVTGGLTWAGAWGTYQLQTDKVFFDIHEGYNEHPAVRGKDDVIPGLPGRYRRNRVDDRLIVELRGWVRGEGSTPTERAEDFRASVTALKAVMDPTQGAGTLSVIAPYLGLPSGSDSLSDVYPVNIMGSPLRSTMSYARFSIELEAVGNPPRWDEDGS